MSNVFRKLVRMLKGVVDNIKIMIFHLYWLLFLKKHFRQSFEIVVNNKYSLEEFNESLWRWSDDMKENTMKELNISFIPYDEIFGQFIDNYNYMPTEHQPVHLHRFMYQGPIYRILCTENITYTDKIVSWTMDYNVLRRWFNNDIDHKKATILIGHTNNDYGFNFGKYNRYYANVNNKPSILLEQEVIIRESKQYVVEEFYGTWNEFKVHVKQLNLIDKND